MAINPALIKAAVYAATDKRIWVVLGSVIAGTVFFIIAVAGTVINMFSFDDSASADASPAYVAFISDMQSCYGKLDTEVTALNAVIEGEQIDKDQIHAVFYTLYFGEDKNMEQDFYRRFVECFVTRRIENGVETITASILNSAYERLESVTGKEITASYQRQVNELYSVLRFGLAQTGGGTDENIGGAPAEAYNDEVFRTLMAEAEKYIGYPYVWGGSSPATSFDCSGYICWVYTRSGMYNLPRATAQGIYNQCVRISAAEAKPGDLVFFTRTYVSADPVTHIGIYVGGGKMLHCGDPIKYVSIQTEYWRNRFYAFGRLT